MFENVESPMSLCAFARYRYIVLPATLVSGYVVLFLGTVQLVSKLQLLFFPFPTTLQRSIALNIEAVFISGIILPVQKYFLDYLVLALA